jgi:hypothetical protein
MAPDLGNVKTRINWQLVQRWCGDFDLDDKVRAGVDACVEVGLTCHLGGSLDLFYSEVRHASTRLSESGFRVPTPNAGFRVLAAGFHQ